MKVTNYRKIIYGETQLDESHIFINGDQNIKRDILLVIYLIKTENHTILVDSGCETMPGFVVKNFTDPIVLLKDIGISVKDITDVVITHSHHDHIELVRNYPYSTIHIQKEEYDLGKDYIPSNFNINLFEKKFLIDNCVKVLNIGGHSIGSSVVEFEYNNDHYVICGDECYTEENFKKRIPTGSSYSPLKSKQFVEKYASDEYIRLLCHG